MLIRVAILSCLWAAHVHAAIDIQRWQSTHGAEVYFVATHELPIVDIQIVFDAGSTRNSDKPGLAMLVNNSLDEGADSLTVDQISQGFEDLGAIYTASSGYDSSSVRLRSLVEEPQLSLAIKNLNRVIRAPDFPIDALERQKQRTLVGLKQKQQLPSALAMDAYMAKVFGEHPYAIPVEGFVESITNIEPEDVVAFHKQFYVIKNVIVAIVGDMNTQQAKQLVEKALDGVAVGQKAISIPKVSPVTEPQWVEIEHPSVQSHVLLGQTGVKRKDVDYFSLYVANHILGGGGMTSRLFKEIREKRGLSYSVYSYFSPMKENGPFVIGLQTHADKVDQALEVLKDNLHTFIKHGPSEEELIAAKKNITGSFPLRISSNGKILGYLVTIGFYGLPLDYLDTFNDRINAVTTQQIKGVIKRRLQQEKFISVIVGRQQAEQN